MAHQTMFQVLAKLLLATSHRHRQVAHLVPMLWNCPQADEIVGSKWEAPTGEMLNVYYPAFPSDEGGTWMYNRPNPGDLPVDPREMFSYMETNWGACFVLCKEGEGSQPIIVSPKLAKHLGTADGGQLNLYAAVVYQLGLLMQSPYPPEDKVWSGEWKQWWASHNTAIMEAMIGGEISREQAKAGPVGDSLRAHAGVYAAKVGGCLFNLELADGSRFISKPGELYVSTASPLAKLDGKHVIPWRNPMPLMDCLKVVAIGPATTYCKAPSVELADYYFEDEDDTILSDSKVFAHPFQISKTAGDTDGDGWQFLCLEKLLEWACKPANQEAIDAIPGLREGLMEYFLDEE